MFLICHGEKILFLLDISKVDIMQLLLGVIGACFAVCTALFLSSWGKHNAVTSASKTFFPKLC
jgi:hypothetical protein